jgi:hypothetical protein
MVRERDRFLRWCVAKVMGAMQRDMKSEAEQTTSALMRYMSRTDSIVLSLRPPVELPPEVQKFVGHPTDDFEP